MITRCLFGRVNDQYVLAVGTLVETQKRYTLKREPDGSYTPSNRMFAQLAGLNKFHKARSNEMIFLSCRDDMDAISMYQEKLEHRIKKALGSLAVREQDWEDAEKAIKDFNWITV